MKRVLIISYYWPPSGGSGVQRWVKFSKYLPSEGWMPVIYTPENPELIAVDNSLASEVPEEVEVIRTPIFEPYGIYRKLTGKKGGAQSGEVNPVSASDKSLSRRLSLFIRGNFFIPDPRCLWIGPSVKFLKNYLKKHPVDVIVSTGPPHSMHLIARKVALATSIPWIADFRDPWTRMFYFKHLSLTPAAKRIHARLEKKVLDSATAVVAVSPPVRDEFRQMTVTPVSLITNGFDETDLEKVEPDGFFNITHTGLFAADGIPDVLWKVLADKSRNDELFRQKLKIRLVGKTDTEIISSLADAGLENNVVNLGYQPHSVAVHEQAKATIMLLPLRKEPEYKAVLPGKLFEYLASGHKILGIGQPDGAMASILDETGRGKTFWWEDEDGIRSFIDNEWSLFLEGRSLSATLEDIAKYSRKGLSKAMADLFNEIALNRS